MGLVDKFRSCHDIAVQWEGDALVTVKVIVEGKEVLIDASRIAAELLEYLEKEKKLKLDDNAKAAIAYAIHRAYKEGYDVGYDVGYDDCEADLDWDEWDDEDDEW